MGKRTIALALLLGFAPTAANMAAPVARWSFDGGAGLRIEARGELGHDQPGPRPPEFPRFADDNMAVRFDGNGARYFLDDPGEGSEFDFTNGDSITLEAWLDVAE